MVLTFTLGDPISGDTEGVTSYGVRYFDADEERGKRLGVRLSETITAYVYDNVTDTQSNYPLSVVQVRESTIVVKFNDASLGVETVGIVDAFSLLGVRDIQNGVPVTLLT